MEKWLPIIGFEGTYEVSNLGQVRRIKPYNNSPFGKILKHKRAGRGYSQVNLYLNNKCHPKYVHRLVADAFLGGIPDGLEVNHKDLDKSNNNADNLEICDRSKNNKHAIDNGARIMKGIPGSKHWKSCISESDVLSIINTYKVSGLSMREVGIKFGVSRDVVNNIIQGRGWKHVPR